jgi:hypothetical protein
LRRGGLVREWIANEFGNRARDIIHGKLDERRVTGIP